MTQHRFSDSRTSCFLFGMFICVATLRCAEGEPTTAAVTAFNSYVSTVESRLTQQHRSRDAFLASVGSDPQSEVRLRRGELIVEKLTPSTGSNLPGALFHHWRGTAFVAGAKGVHFERLMKDFARYPQLFYPEVLDAKAVAWPDDRGQERLEARMRVRQRHVITVVMDTSYDIAFGRLDARHGFSATRSTQISEIDSPGTPTERVLNSHEEHGFLWRLNTYWSFEERDGGLYMQIESVSLTRSIPSGFGWVVRPYVEGVPRESLEFTLRSTRSALQK